jgi:hypothetical protein
VRSVFVALLALLLAAIPAAASAKFTRVTMPAAMSITSDILSPPTNMKVTCFGSGGRIKLTWTITADTYASGYLVYGKYSGTEYSETVPGTRTVATYAPADSVPSGTIVTMASYYKSWTSARTTAVTTGTCP